MKKIVILLFIVFTTVNSAFFGQKTVSASAVIDNKEYWSIKELLEYEPTAIALHDSTCGDDNDCKIKIYYEQDDYHVGGIYSAWRAFKDNRLLVTSINPVADSFRIFYQNESLIFKYLGMYEWPESLNEISAVWLDENASFYWDETENLSQPYPWYVVAQRNGKDTNGVHFLLSEDNEKQPYGWFPENQEVEFHDVSYSLEQNKQNIIYAEMHSEQMYFLNIADYSGCLASPYYQNGMECRLLFSEAGFLYEPYWPDEDTITRIPTSNSMPDAAENNSSSAESTVGDLATSNDSENKTVIDTNNSSISEDKITTGEPIIDNILHISESKQTELANTEETIEENSHVALQVLDPDANEPALDTFRKEGNCTNIIDFPWWLIVVLIVGDILIVCLFLPTCKKIKNY